MKTQHIIEQLGGTAAVARLCAVKMSAVSQWKTNGIPKARLMYLKVIKPEVFTKGVSNEN